VHADEAASWDNLHERFEVKRINHQEAYSLDGACTNMAEEYFSRLRRAAIGIHHHIAGAHLLRYAQESSWREDNRRVSNGEQVNRIDPFLIPYETSDRRLAWGSRPTPTKARTKTIPTATKKRSAVSMAAPSTPEAIVLP
jgi:ISXO2-like transposase domain